MSFVVRFFLYWVLTVVVLAGVLYGGYRFARTYDYLKSNVELGDELYERTDGRYRLGQLLCVVDSNEVYHPDLVLVRVKIFSQYLPGPDTCSPEAPLALVEEDLLFKSFASDVNLVCTKQLLGKYKKSGDPFLRMLDYEQFQSLEHRLDGGDGYLCALKKRRLPGMEFQYKYNDKLWSSDVGALSSTSSFTPPTFIQVWGTTIYFGTMGLVLLVGVGVNVYLAIRESKKRR